MLIFGLSQNTEEPKIEISIMQQKIRSLSYDPLGNLVKKNTHTNNIRELEKKGIIPLSQLEEVEKEDEYEENTAGGIKWGEGCFLRLLYFHNWSSKCFFPVVSSFNFWRKRYEDVSR